ncbi:MAG: hypothetical protein IH991_19740 [Planctomycetes bacterium]|nr:hypothetical protein [Planctomycetota bacterium]
MRTLLLLVALAACVAAIYRTVSRRHQRATSIASFVLSSGGRVTVASWPQGAERVITSTSAPGAMDRVVEVSLRALDWRRLCRWRPVELSNQVDFEPIVLLLGRRPLHIPHTPDDDTVVNRLVQLPHLTRLSCRLSDVSSKGFAIIGKMDTLEFLDLSGTDVSDSDLLHVSNLQGLKYLSVGGTAITDTGAEHLKSLRKLEVLDLGGTDVSDAVFDWLYELPALTHVYLDDTDVETVNLTRMESLKYLTVRASPVRHVRLPAACKIESLDLAYTNVSDRSVNLGGRACRIERLDVVGTGVSLPGLVASGALCCVRELSVSASACSDGRLLDRASSDKLRVLRVVGSVDPDTMRVLKSHLPRGVRIEGIRSGTTKQGSATEPK